MALQKTKVPISFAEGLDTKTDDKQTLPTKLLELENGIFNKIGKINKRFGYDILPQTIVNESTEVSEGRGLTRYKDELVLFDSTKLLSYLDANETWIEKGDLVSVTTKNQAIIRNPYQQSGADFASNGITSISVWEDSRGGCRYSVLDESSGTFILSDAEFTASGTNPKVFLLGNNFVLTYVNGTVVSRRTVSTLTPTVLTAELDIITNLDPVDKVYDGALINDRLYFVWNANDGGGAVRMLYLLPITFTVSTSAVEPGEIASTCATITSDSSDNVWAVYYDGTDVKAFAYNSNLDTQETAPTSLETVANIRNVTAIETDSADNTITAFYEVSNTTSGNPDNFVKKNTINAAASVGTASVFNRSVGIASKLFSYNNNQYFILVHESDLQSTYFVYSISGDIVSKISTNVAGGYTANSILPEVVALSSGVYKTALLRKIQFISENGDAFSRLGVEATKFDFTAPNNFLTAELGNNLHITGGAMQMYDGLSAVEHGFSVFPENVSLAEVNTGAGTIPNGTYQYAVVYAWIDNQGQLHRSAPSIAESITVAAGPSDVEITAPTLRITKKEQAFLEVYRTEDAGTVFYKVTSVDSPVFNDKTVDTITFTDDVTDADLISNEILYTTGGVLENIAAPASSLITTFKSRVIINDQDDENVFRYSKIRTEGFPVEFNDTLARSIDSRGGALTAFNVLDDKLILFKKSAIFYTAGEGPNNLGLQDDFLDPLLVTSDVGCIEPNSVVETPIGLMFQSRKGIYLLDRSLSTRYIGAPVERFNDVEITSATLVPDSNEVRFTTANNLALVYNYYFQQWSTFTNHEAQGATSYEDKFTFVKLDGRVYQENRNKFRDGAELIKLKLVTSWMKMATLSGYQRVYKAMLLGEFLSDHKLLVKVGYDYNTSFTQETLIDAATLLATNNYGDGTPYGSGDTLYGGAYQLYQWELRFKRQKCQSIRISIEDVQDSNFDAGYSVSSLTFEVGIKQGLNPNTSRFGPA
jgi:hypothetical protein